MVLVTLVFHLTTPEFLPPLKSTCAVDKPSTLDRQLNPGYSFNMGVAHKISKQNIAGTYHIPSLSSFQSVVCMAYIPTLCWSCKRCHRFCAATVSEGLYMTRVVTTFTPGSTCHVEKLDYIPIMIHNGDHDIFMTPFTVIF